MMTTTTMGGRRIELYLFSKGGNERKQAAAEMLVAVQQNKDQCTVHIQTAPIVCPSRHADIHTYTQYTRKKEWLEITNSHAT
jgi:hypothetical protein